MKAKEIRNVLMKGNSEDLKRRRKIILLSALGLLDFSFISLYQTGIIKNMPDIPLPVFDSNKVNSSKKAYVMGLPDAPVSALAYASNLVFASAGGNKKTGRKDIFDTLLSASVIGNAAGAAYYLYEMIFQEKKICIYCLAGAVINFASAAILFPVIKRSRKRVI